MGEGWPSSKRRKVKTPSPWPALFFAINSISFQPWRVQTDETESPGCGWGRGPLYTIKMGGSRGDCDGPGTPPLSSLDCLEPLPLRLYRESCVFPPVPSMAAELKEKQCPTLVLEPARTRENNQVCSLLHWGSGEIISFWPRTDAVLRKEKHLLTVSIIPITWRKGPLWLEKS